MQNPPMNDPRTDPPQNTGRGGSSQDDDEAPDDEPLSPSQDEGASGPATPPTALGHCSNCLGRNFGVICLVCGNVFRVCCLAVVTYQLAPSGDAEDFNCPPCATCSDMDAYHANGNSWTLGSCIRAHRSAASVVYPHPGHPAMALEPRWEPEQG